MGKYNLIIFDLDGTLVDSISPHFKALKETLAKHNIKINDRDVKIRMSKPAMMNELKEEMKFPEDSEILKEEEKEAFIKWMKNKDITFPRVKEMLETLKSEYIMAVATGSTKKECNMALNKKIEPFFKLISTVEDTKNPKPSPDQILLIAKKLKIPIKNCLVIGDSIYDAQAAQAAGMYFIGVTTGFTPKAMLETYPNLAILSFVTELPKYLTKQAK